MFNPSRGGVRGGQDQFSWDNVKEDKYRENYLGHSLKAPVGRWQKGKDLTWYAKTNAEKDAARTAELKAIKQAEEEAMLEALGYPVKKKANSSMIDAKELNSILEKEKKFGSDEMKEEYEIRGLGFKDSASKSLTGKVEATKFTSDSSFPVGMPAVSSKMKSESENHVDPQSEIDSDASASPKKHKDKKHKKSKSKSKSKKRRHDSDEEKEVKKHSSSRSKHSDSKRHRTTQDSPLPQSKELRADREASREQQSSRRHDRSSPHRARDRDVSPRRRSRSPRRDRYGSRHYSRY